MEPTPVPIVEINPGNPDDVDVSFVPLQDLDDFLEDLSDDFELGFGELGAMKGGRASVKASGKLKIQLPAKKSIFATKGKVAVKVPVAKLKAAAKLAASLPKGSKAKAKITRLIKVKVATAKKQHTAKSKATGKAIGKGVSLKVRHQARMAVKARAKVTAKLNRQPTRAAAKIAAGARKVVKVSAGKFAPVPLSTKALRHKAAAKRTAARVVGLAPHTKKHMKPRAKVAVTAALHGTPLRPKGVAKPARAAVRAVRKAGVRCCIIARPRSGVVKTGGLAARFRAKRRIRCAGPMKPLKFKATVTGLLSAIEARSTSPAITAAAARIRKITGVAV